MKKLIFIFFSVFLALTINSNAFGATYTSWTLPVMADTTFQQKAENLIGDYPAIWWDIPLCSESEYNISSEITATEISKIQNCGKKIASKIIAINNVWITNTNSYRKQTRNDYLKTMFDKRVANFQQIKSRLLAYQALSDSYLYFNFKPILKDVKDNTAYTQYTTLINAKDTVDWSLAQINKYLKNFQAEKMNLYYNHIYITPTGKKIGINANIDDSGSLVTIKNQAINSINQLYTKLDKYNTNSWTLTGQTNWLLFKDLSDFNDYMSYLSWSVSNSLDIQIAELNTAIKYRLLSEQLYPSNDALLYLIRQLYIIQTNVNDNTKNLTYLNQPIILENIKKGIMSWFIPTLTFYPNQEKPFNISTSTYEISPNLTNDKKKILGTFIDENLLFNLSSTTTDSNRVDSFVLKKEGLDTITTDATKFSSEDIYGNAKVSMTSSTNNSLKLTTAFTYIKSKSQTFTKVGSIYTANPVPN